MSEEILAGVWDGAGNKEDYGGRGGMRRPRVKETGEDKGENEALKEEKENS